MVDILVSTYAEELLFDMADSVSIDLPSYKANVILNQFQPGLEAKIFDDGIAYLKKEGWLAQDGHRVFVTPKGRIKTTEILGGL